MQKKFTDLCFSRLKEFSGGGDTQVHDLFDNLEHLGECHEIKGHQLTKTLKLLMGPALRAFNTFSETKRNSPKI